jgi:hypothetical protein
MATARSQSRGPGGGYDGNQQWLDDEAKSESARQGRGFQNHAFLITT